LLNMLGKINVLRGARVLHLLIVKRAVRVTKSLRRFLTVMEWSFMCITLRLN
jgi:hypothetical protein